METIDFSEVIKDPETISVVEGLIGVVTKNKDGLYDKDWMIPRGTVGITDEEDYVVKSDKEMQKLPNGTYAMYNMTGIAPISYATLIVACGRNTYNSASSFMIIMQATGGLYYREKWDDWSPWYKITTTRV